MSKNQAAIRESVTFRVDAVGGPAPTNAHWEFGDGRHADGLTTSHAWTLPGTYQVSVRATFADGQTTTVSVAVVVRVAVPTVPVPRYTLTVQVQGAGTVTGGGILCPPVCTVTAVSGTAVTLTARAAAGAHLSAWGGACSGTATTCTVVLAGGRSVSAKFSANLAAPVQLSPADGTLPPGTSKVEQDRRLVVRPKLDELAGTAPGNP
jgi:PKD repeat protein